MTITIDDREVAALRRFLDEYMPEFEFAVARVELQRDRHDLAQQFEVLRALRARLGEVPMPPGHPYRTAYQR